LIRLSSAKDGGMRRVHFRSAQLVLKIDLTDLCTI